MKNIIAALVILLCATPVFAQVQLDGPSLYLAVAPQYPAASEQVTLTIQSPLLDLSTRMITWKNSGTVVSSGEGEVVYRMTAPAAGEQADISVAVEGVAEPASISISPASVDLMWEANSYAPGLYRGRHLPSLGSTITLQALPHISILGAEIAAEQLIYTWSEGGRVIQSGKGKSSISIPVADFSESSTISVSVTTSDKSVGAQRSALIETRTPDVRMYFEHPLYGTLYHTAVSERTHISDTEMSFTAIPYFANAENANDSFFSYRWRVNGASVDPNKAHPNTITINAGAGGGEANITLSVTHAQNYNLDTNDSWQVIFGSMASPESTTDPFSGQ